MQDAAKSRAGAVTGFAGMGMVGGMGGGVNVANLMQQGMAAQQAQAAAAAAAAPTPAPAPAAAPAAAQGSWTCPVCGSGNSGKFCSNCGQARPEAPKASFCTECGTKFDPENPPKFCPNCGTKLG